MDYHPNLRDLPKLIKNHLLTLCQSLRMRKLFSDDKVQIRTGFRRTKNLKDLLVPSSLPDTDQENCTDSDNIGCYRCHRRVCDACQNFLVHAKRIKSVVTCKSYKIRQSLSCGTDYVIYCATLYTVIDNLLIPASISDHACQTTKVTSRRTREHAV